MLKKILLLLLIIPLSFAQTDIFSVGDNVFCEFSLTPPSPSQENKNLGTYTENYATVLLFKDLHHEILYNEKITRDVFDYDFNNKFYQPGNYYIQATVVSYHSEYKYGKWTNYTTQNNSESYYFTVEGKPSIMEKLKSNLNLILSDFSDKLKSDNFKEFVNDLILKIKSKIGGIKLWIR